MYVKRFLCSILLFALVVTLLASCAVKPSDSQEQTTVTTTMSPTTTNQQIDEDLDGPLSRYDNTVVLQIGKAVSQDDGSLPAGDTLENNVYTRYTNEILNIDTQIVWQASGEAYGQKVKMSIASGDLPDVMSVSYVDMKAAYEAGLIEDLTAIYEKYALPLAREIYATADNKAIETATFDGKLMAIPSQQATGDFPTLTWVRKDWLDILGLTPPKTAEDIAKIAKAFIDQDPNGTGANDTVGIVNSTTFNNIYAANESYPQMWVEYEGKAHYGSLLPGTKDALSTLNSWYQSGLLDREFAIRTDASELIAGGRSGLFFAPWWFPWAAISDSVKNDPDANWVSYAAPLNKEGKLNYRIPGVSNTFVIVRKGYQNPEAVMKCINLEYATLNDPEYALDTKGANHMYWPVRHLIVRANEIEEMSIDIRAALEGKVDENEIASWNEWRKICYQSALSEQENPRGDMASWPNGYAYTVGAVPLTGPVNKIYGLFSGVTDTMQSPQWGYLTKLEQETFTKIIMGELPVEHFDIFVSEWLKNGGQQVIEEVNQLLGW